VPERDGEVIGIAMAGPQQQPDNECAANLYLIYVVAAYHGSGAGPALLKAVLDPDASASLWVVDPNPRAQAFYRKHSFRSDGICRLEDGVSEIRMIRPARQNPTPTARQK
jgi:predicted GNAT family N-acyltransferase